MSAQKREQRLQDVPVAVTALSADSLRTNRITNIRDLDGLAPNLTIRTGSAGASSPIFSMRGLVSTGTAPGADRGIAMYIDGAYIGSASGSLFDIADIERVEVLRGPQGTLFGRNSTGGAVSFITRDPDGEFGGHVEASYGNYDQFRTRAQINTPQVGPLSARFTYTHNERRGEIRNLGAGTVLDYTGPNGGEPLTYTSPKWLGSDNTEAFSAAVKLDLIDDLRLVYKFDYTKSAFTPLGVGLTGLFPAGAGPLGGVLDAYPSGPNATPITSRRPDAVNNQFTTPAGVKNYGHNLTAGYRINDVLSVKNIFSWRKLHYFAPGAQLDGLGGAQLGGVPFAYVITASEGRDRQWSDEVQFNITTDWFAITAGYLHFEIRQHTGAFGTALNSTVFTPLPGFVIPDSGVAKSVSDVRSDAFYVQPEIHLTSELDLVLGARITKDHKRIEDNTIIGASSIGLYSDSRPTYLAGLNYKPTNDILLYAKFSTGYISGGSLATLIYQPETAKSFEGGVKADWFDRRLRTNLALFHVKYKNQQFPAAGSVLNIPASQVLFNAGDSRAYGLELETTIVPVRQVTLGANFGYTNFKYTRLDPRLVATGGTLPYFRPKWTGNFSAQYDSEPVVGDASLMVRVDASYKSKTFASPAAPTADILRAVTVDHNWLVNGRAALRGFDLGAAKAEIAIFGRNLFNNRNITNTINLGFAFPTDYERARSYGIEASLDF